MSQKTGIAWTDSTWNPVVGCQKISEGCRNCYAKDLHDLRHKAFQDGKKLPMQYAEPFGTIQMMYERLEMPLRWKKPRRIFVNSVSDLFHQDVEFNFIDDVFEIMRKAHWHTFQVLTKRPERAVEWFRAYQEKYSGWKDEPWPRNVWMGVSVENQEMADRRIPHLFKLPAWVRFLSCEPLLGPVNLGKVHDKNNHVYFDVLDGMRFDYGSDGFGVAAPMAERIHWVIVGGESGRAARPMYADWARGLRDQCQQNRVPYFFKQWGEWVHTSQPQVDGKLGKALHRWGDDTFSLRVGTQTSGHLLDGVEWRQMPRSVERSVMVSGEQVAHTVPADGANATVTV